MEQQQGGPGTAPPAAGPAASLTAAAGAPGDGGDGFGPADGASPASHVSQAEIDLEAAELIREAGGLTSPNLRSGGLGSIVSKDELNGLTSAQKAALISKRLRDRRVQQERELAKQQEKAKFESQKQLTEARRQLADAEERRLAQEVVREREEARLAKEKQIELVRREYRERFGKDIPEEELLRSSLQGKSSREQVLHWIGALTKIKKTNPERQEAVIACVNTLLVYLSNAKDHPTETKYHQIKTTNKVFAERVAPFSEAIELLKAAGFVPVDSNPDDSDSGVFLRLKSTVPDGFLLGECIKFLKLLTRLS